jgi:hypothetical protein
MITPFDTFLDQLEAYLAATADSAYLLLLDPDDAVRRRGVFNCWTLGRHDPRPLMLLRRLLPSLTERSPSIMAGSIGATSKRSNRIEHRGAQQLESSRCQHSPAFLV